MFASGDKPPIDAILQKVLDAVPFQFATDRGVDVVRRQLAELPRRLIHPQLRTEDRTIPGPAGHIPVRIYRPPPDTAPVRPVVVFFHGGGFVAGDLDTHDAIARHHAVGADAVVVSVAYRLAPEHPYPAAVRDAVAATSWVFAHAGELGVDPGRLAVAGDSGGGTLSAVVAQQARDAGRPTPVFQLLWYPGTTYDPSLPSFRENAHAPILDRAAVAAFSRWYAGDVDLRNPPPGMAPGRATSFAGLPPAYIAVAGHDPLRDDGIRYGELLTAAGVPVHLDHAAELVHGYLGYAGVVPAATDATDRGLAALHAALYR